MSDETPGAGQGALPPRESSTPLSRSVAERPAMRLTQVAGGQYVLTTQTPGGVPALAQLSPGTNLQQSGVTRIISISPSRTGQISPLRPSQANQSIVNVLTKPRVNTNLRLQLFQNVEQSTTTTVGAAATTPVSSNGSPGVRSPLKRPSAGGDRRDIYSAKLQRVMNHRIVRSKLVKEKYNEHLTEMYFLETGGNLLDLHQFAKRPKTAHYLAYLKEHSIDPKEANEANNLVSVGQTIPGTPSATPASSLPGISHSSSVAETQMASSSPSTSSVVAVKTPSVHQHTPMPTMSLSGVSVPVSGSPNVPAAVSQEQIVEKAKQEAYVMQRIADLQKEGLWSDRRLPKVQEMQRQKTHWDYLLEEMVWLAADFAQERKWKKAAAKKCAKMVQKYFQDKALAAQRAEKAHEQNLRRIAAYCAKEIKNFWNNVEKLVEYKQHTILEEKRKRALDQQLSFIVDQTEKYSQLLAEGMMNKSTQDVAVVASLKNNNRSSAVSSASVSRANSDDEFVPEDQSSTDDEETIEQEEKEVDKEGQSEEVKALQKESEMDLEEFLRELPKDYLENRDKIRLTDEENSDVDVSSTNEIPTSSSSKRRRVDVENDDDVDFRASGSEEEDDEATIDEQEKNGEEEKNHEEELKDLEAENEMSIEELRKKYCSGNLGDVEIEEDEEDKATSSGEEMEESERESSEEEEDENEVSSGGEEEMAEREGGLELLLEEERDETKTEENDDLINDAAAIAESIQPKGNTLSSTNVSTKIPFLLKYSLREYQHIGLDWLVTMFERKLNGILADEMGLGKTIQTIALLAHLACEKENWGPHLIVVPTSVMLNWEMECKKWCPAFKILTYYGSQKERKMKRTGWTKPNAFHICITSYKLVIQDHQSFRRKKWKYLILDEAQNIKNFKSQRWQLLLNFQTQQRLLLTGTPLQNNLMELWSLMHFLMPNVFQSHREFKEWFSNPVTGMIEGNNEYNENIIKRLHKVLRPFLLRRLKSEVEKQMPKKYEHVVMCRLSKRQRFLYDDYMSRAKTRETLASGNLLSVINVLMQLRKVCNHPNLFEVRPTISPFRCDGINLHIPSIVFAALEYQIWSHVNYVSLNLDLLNLESHLTAYQCYRARKLRTPRKTIETLRLPEPRPPCPPVKLAMRVKKNPIVFAVNNNNNSDDNGAPVLNHVTSTTTPKKQQNCVDNNSVHHQQVNKSTASAGSSSGIKLKMAPNQPYGMQLVQQQGGVVKAIPVNIAAAAASTSTSGSASATSLLKTGDNKMAASFAQLVQTSTGKHLLLTSTPGLAGTAAAAAQKLTLLSKHPVSTSTNSSAPTIHKAYVKFQLTSVNATTPTNTVTTAATQSAFPDPKEPTKVGAKFIEQLYANRSSNNLDVRWSAKNEKKGELKEIDLKTRLKIMASVNETRCTAYPIYGDDLYAAFRLKGLKDTNARWRNGRSYCDDALLGRGHVADFLRDALYSPERRILELAPLTDRFVFYVPSVNAPRPDLQIWQPRLSAYTELRDTPTRLSHAFSKPATPLHRLATAMVTQFPDPRLIQYDCGKLQTLDRLLRKLKSEGHRVLIFTQMTKMLDVLEAFLNFHGHIYLRLDGTTKVDQRQVLMERFNGDTRIFAFILSTRSGGVGVNLTGADTVIFYDSDWNPTMDAQAQDRCHRIGQTRDVHIYRLVSERTIEENILKKANQKRLLGDLAIEGGNFTTAYFKSSTIQDLFNIDQSEESAANRLTSEITSTTTTTLVQQRGVGGAAAGDGSKQSLPSSSNQRASSPMTSDENKMAVGALESALAACEDDQDVQAARTAKAEAVADLAEFDENIPLGGEGGEGTATTGGAGGGKDKNEQQQEMSKAEMEIDNVIKKLSPIERYAMNFIEQTESAWSAEQLAAAERLIEEQKIEWEKNRLAAMREEEERRARELQEDNELLTFSREDATNQIWVSDNGNEPMPMWCPPTPPTQETDVYVDAAVSFLYDTASTMTESQLPAVYVKKETKRSRVDAGLPDSRRSSAHKMPRKEPDATPVNAPRSLFHPHAYLKMRRDARWQKYHSRGGAGGGAAASRSPLGVSNGSSAAGVGQQKATALAELQQPFHDWTIHEEMALLKVVQNFQGLPLNLTVTAPAHTPNWDFVSDYVNAASVAYRSPKQCRQRYENTLMQREEGKQLYDQTLRKKKNKNSTQSSQKFPYQQQQHQQPLQQQKNSNRPMRTAQLYAQDNNLAFAQKLTRKHDSLRALPLTNSTKQSSSSVASGERRSGVSGNLQKNPKHTAVLNECGIDLERPLLPVEVAARRAERMAREKKMTPEARLQLMKGLAATQQQQQTSGGGGSGGGGGSASSTPTNVITVVGGQQQQLQVQQQQQQVLVTQQQQQQQGNSAAAAVAASSSAPNTPPSSIRGQRLIASPLQTSGVVSVANLSPAQLQAATQRLIVSANAAAAAAAAQNKTVLTASSAATSGVVQVGVQGKSISPAQLQMIRQAASFKQQVRVQTQQQGGVKTSTVTIGGQPAVVQFTQAQQPRPHFVRQGSAPVAVGPKTAITRTVTESEVAQILKKQQQLQQHKALVAAAAGANASGAATAAISPQVFAQAFQQAGTSGTPVATLVKTVSSSGATQAVTIPVTIATAKTLANQMKTTNPQQLRQLQLQQQLLAQKKLGTQKLSIAQVAAAAKQTGGGATAVQTQLIVGSKPLPAAMTVQQFQQVIRSPLGAATGAVAQQQQHHQLHHHHHHHHHQGSVVLAKGGQRVIPVAASGVAAGTKQQTIQVVAATSQGLRPQQGTSSTLAGALAGLKVQQGQTAAQAQQALLSQVSAALQGQTVNVRQTGSPVRIQTSAGTPIVAVSVQQQQQQQNNNAHGEQQQQIARFLKKQ